MHRQRNEIIYERDFLRDVRKLPIEVQNKLSELLETLEIDAYHSTLHTKPLSPPLQGMFSFRINRDYRVGFKFRMSYTIQLLVADKRDKIYKRLYRKL